MGEKSFCDICRAEEGNLDSTFFVTALGSHSSKGIKECCPVCHEIITKTEEKLNAYFQNLQDEMMKNLIINMKKEHLKHGFRVYWPSEKDTERIIRIKSCYDCPYYERLYCNIGEERKLLEGPNPIPQDCPLEYYNTIREQKVEKKKKRR